MVGSFIKNIQLSINILISFLHKLVLSFEVALPIHLIRSFDPESCY